MSVSLASIRTFLATVRRHLRRHALVSSLVGVLVLAGVLALVLPLAGWALAPSRPTAMALVAIAGLIGGAGVITAFILGVIVPTRKWRADAAVARWVGAREKPLASDLLSTVELNAAPTTPTSPSPALVAALTEVTSERVSRIDTATLVDRRWVRRGRLALGALAVAHGALFVFATDIVMSGWRRLSESPERPFGGATQSSVPLVGDLGILLTPPAYSRRPQLHLPSTAGDFRALAGTRARFVTRALEVGGTLSIVLEREGTEPEIVPLTETSVAGELTGEITITGAARYRFQSERPGGRRTIESVAHVIELEPDQAPTVELYAPGDDLDVTDMKRIELAYVVEDDFGVAKVELVWEVGGKSERKVLAALPDTPGRAQGKVVWDLAEVALPPGAVVSYHLEGTDNDSIDGPNVGRSRDLRLRVFSPREKHEQHLARQAELAEKVLGALGQRLTSNDAGAPPRDELHRQLSEITVELGTLAAAYESDALADKGLREALDDMRGRIDKLVALEARQLEREQATLAAATRRGGAAPKLPPGRWGTIDKQAVGELEDDALALADWLEREQMEGMLDVADEIDAHQKRLAELLAEYARTGDEKLKAEILRQIRAIEQRITELQSKRRSVAEDVLDQFVHAQALQDQQTEGCLEEVRRLVQKGDAAAAQAALERCQRGLTDAASAMEDALRDLRGDRFAEGEKKLDELMDELADVTRDQADIAAEADKIFERYADRADDLMHDLARGAQRRLGATVDRLQEKLDHVPDGGLTPFAREELEIVDKRLTDLERMLADGDIAEALGMARQARQSLETVAGELDAALSDDPHSPWAQATSDALDAVEGAHPLAEKLVSELEAMTPSPDQILGTDDKRRMDALKRRQGMNRDRAKRLGERARTIPGLPGASGESIASRVGEATQPMDNAEQRMGKRDPSGARDEARSAAEALERARQEAQKAARQAQSQGDAQNGDEPVRIPGSDEYKAPARFREELLEAMKRRAPAGYDDQVRRYYEELIR
ncbi:MAG TPA: DUF4175 family protein [Kofleriaceae bacterium]|nr:DUF4175 family protein [Kofleriaceae bacterium]